MVGCAIPDLIYKNIPSDLISIFHTWRRALTQLGIVLASALYGIMIETFDGIWLLLIGSIGYLACAIGYCGHFGRTKNNT